MIDIVYMEKKRSKKRKTICHTRGKMYAKNNNLLAGRIIQENEIVWFAYITGCSNNGKLLL